MIHSLFLINHAGDIFLEKHWKSVISRSVCDYFFEAKEKAVEPENVPPVLQTPHHYLISIYRDKLFFLSVVQTEVPPLFVIEFLHRVADTIQVWLNSLCIDYWLVYLSINQSCRAMGTSCLTITLSNILLFIKRKRLLTTTKNYY